MEQVRTKRKFTIEELEKISAERAKEKAKRIAELDALDLTDEEKEILIGIKMGLEDAEAGIGYTEEEIIDMFFGEDGLCT